MTYHLMIERDDAGSPWRAEFGSIDPEDVTAEIEDRRDHGAKSKNLRRIAFGRVPSQRQVDDRLAAMNGARDPELAVATRPIEVFR